MTGFFDHTPDCPACDAPTQYMGQLGSLVWWTCRACGMQCNTPADTEDEHEVPRCRRPKRRQSQA